MIISLFYNDAFYQPVSEEFPYWEKMEASSFDQGPFGRMAMDLRVWRNTTLYRKYHDPMQRGEEVPEQARELFERGLNSFRNIMTDTVGRIQAAGAAVLLVKEPFRLGSRGVWDRESYYGALDEVGREKGVHVIDPLEAILTKGIAQKDLFIDKVHMNRKGNALMAACLAEAILDLGFVPPP